MTTATLRLRALLLVSLVAVSACARNRPGRDDGNIAESEAAEPTTIEFRNESLTQADVFVASSGTGARRIGTVFSGRTDTLTIPREIAIRGTITVVARLLAHSRAPSTGSIAISPGTRLSVRLPMDERSLFVLPAS